MRALCSIVLLMMFYVYPPILHAEDNFPLELSSNGLSQGQFILSITENISPSPELQNSSYSSFDLYPNPLVKLGSSRAWYIWYPKLTTASRGLEDIGFSFTEVPTEGSYVAGVLNLTDHYIEVPLIGPDDFFDLQSDKLVAGSYLLDLIYRQGSQVIKKTYEYQIDPADFSNKNSN